jgi:uncharacterized protein (TIGR03790 family)
MFPLNSIAFLQMRPFAAIIVLACALSARALEPDNLLLITNKNNPQSRKLAEFYAASRKVPDHRILELDLPDAEEVPFDVYESQVIPAVREFLASSDLQNKVTCLVTFYGVPLRIGNRVNTPTDLAEVAALKQDLPTATAQIQAIVDDSEKMAKEADPKFSPGADQSLAGLATRDTAARTVIGRHAMGINDPGEFQIFMDRADNLLGPLVGVAPPLQRKMYALAGIASHWTAAQKQEAESLRDQLLKMRGRFDTLQAHRALADSRMQLRALVKEQLGLFEYAHLLEGMIEYFNTEGTGAAFDSELALVHWNFYIRGKWLPNPASFKTQRADLPPILMTFRLDAPQPDNVRNLIAASIKTEADGLQGQMVIDAGGNLSIDSNNPGYSAFDRTLRNLADIVRTKTKLPLTFDEKRDVITAHSVKEPIALYCGWYALQNYTPPGNFTPGAVGYHVASFELTTLRNPQNRGWCKGLLSDGIAATLGPVNEPFLSAFPPPDEFFPLLLTGKLTLAEVYWRTNPMVSWQIAMIGDPLYNPFKSHPAMTPESLPQPLQAALKPLGRSTTAPAR